MNINSLSQAARSWYDFNWMSRKYHNWGHATRVANACDLITNHNASDALLLAAWWHDAVYVPGAGSDANERCSSAALAGTVKQTDISTFSDADKTSVNLAQDMIEYTTIENHLHHTQISGDLAILLDADLSSLADPYADFVQTQANVLEENGMTMETHKEKSAEFLHKFLTCRKFIYHTDYAREHWEKAARINIARFCNE